MEQSARDGLKPADNPCASTTYHLRERHFLDREYKRVVQKQSFNDSKISQPRVRNLLLDKTIEVKNGTFQIAILGQHPDGPVNFDSLPEDLVPYVPQQV